MLNQQTRKEKITVDFLTGVAQSLQWLVMAWTTYVRLAAQTENFGHPVRTHYQGQLSPNHWLSGYLSQELKRSECEADNSPTLVEVLPMLKQAQRHEGISQSGGLAPWVCNIATRRYDEWSAKRPGCFILGGWATVTQWTETSRCQRAVIDAWWANAGRQVAQATNFVRKRLMLVRDHYETCRISPSWHLEF